MESGALTTTERTLSVVIIWGGTQITVLDLKYRDPNYWDGAAKISDMFHGGQAQGPNGPYLPYQLSNNIIYTRYR